MPAGGAGDSVDTARASRSPYFANRGPIAIEQGQWIKAGTPLTVGTIDPAELLLTLGCEATARYLVGEVQQVFRGTGVSIDDRHIEIVVRQMVRSVLVTDPADTAASPGEILDRFAFEALNARILAEGGSPALARPALLGLTKTALQTRSWVAAASFQDTGRVLTQAAIGGRTDSLYGLKARIIVGKPIPRQEAGRRLSAGSASQDMWRPEAR